MNVLSLPYQQETTTEKSKTMLQARCSKCNKALEEKRQVIGLGATCEEYVKDEYDNDVKKLIELSGDVQFNWFAIMVDPINILRDQLANVRKDHFAPELVQTLTRLSNFLATHTGESIVPFQTVLDCFSIARNSNPELRDFIFKSLNELGFKRFLIYAMGENEEGNAVLSYEMIKTTYKAPAKMKIVVRAPIRKGASRHYNLEGAKFPGTIHKLESNLWVFDIVHAQMVIDTINKFFTNHDCITVLDSFWKALELSRNLPPEKEETLLMNEVPNFRLISYRKIRKNGAWTLPKTGPNAIYNFILQEGGVYFKPRCNEEWVAYTVPEDKVELIEEFIQDIIDGKPVPYIEPPTKKEVATYPNKSNYSKRRY